MSIKITEKEYHQWLGDHSPKYWRDGNTEILVYPELRDPENSKPFIVRLRGEHYIPVNELVYGVNAAEATERLLAAMHWCSEHDYHDPNSYSPSRAHGYLKHLKDGEMWFEVEPFDITSIVHVDWSSNSF
jgi:hypothetical protein